MNDIGSQRIAAAAFGRAAVAAQNYLREYGVGGILRNALAIYREASPFPSYALQSSFGRLSNCLMITLSTRGLLRSSFLTAPAAYIASQYASRRHRAFRRGHLCRESRERRESVPKSQRHASS